MQRPRRARSDLALPGLLIALVAGAAGCGAPEDEAGTDADLDGRPATHDCDDADPNVYDGAHEWCDALDNDCDGEVDEGYDQDGDGFRTALDAGCAAAWGEGDCDDADAAVHPGAAEACDEVDGDCDGTVDDGFDQDGDGYTSCSGDCDDTEAAVHPGAEEVCNGVDEDCGGVADEAWDLDGDGVAGCVGDCDDADPTVSPLRIESCDRVDNDCDGEVDEGYDQDGDGVPICRGDCDDADPEVFPLATEVCNGIDDDCAHGADDPWDEDGDGVSTCGDPADCMDDEPEVHPGAAELCDGLDGDCDGEVPADEVDADGDGSLVCDADCDDADPSRGTTLPETCDGIDNDCDPATDEGSDGDGDGLSVCAGDCDDGDAEVRPGGTEACDGVDDDCDGRFDEDLTECEGCAVHVREDHTYLYCEDHGTWEDAAGWCADLGYALVTIDDLAENAWVASTTASLDDTAWWIGANDIEDEGVWTWHGPESAFERWAAGEPNDWGGDEDCGYTDAGAGAWNDYPCDATLPFVCEIGP